MRAQARRTLLVTTITLTSLALAHCKRETPAATRASPAVAAEVTAGPDRRVAITVDNDGYHPTTVHASPGQPLTLVFTRTRDEGGCGERVVFTDPHIERDLPAGQPVEVTVTPSAGRLAFACGMNMYRGAIVVQ